MPSKKGATQREMLEISPRSPHTRQLDFFAPPPEQRKPDIRRGAPSELLERLQSFIPTLQEANAKLLTRETEDRSIEHSGGDDELHIQMDLACGVLDLKNLPAIAVAEASLDGRLPPNAGITSNSDPDSGSACNSEEDSVSEDAGIDAQAEICPNLCEVTRKDSDLRFHEDQKKENKGKKRKHPLIVAVE